MPLIVVLVIISIISVITIGIHLTNNKNQQIADNGNNQEEKMQAAIVTETLQSGKTLTVGTTGIYKVELHAGRGLDLGTAKGGAGSKVTGYIWLNNGDKLGLVSRYPAFPSSWTGGMGGVITDVAHGGKGLVLDLNDKEIAIAGGGGGAAKLVSVRGCEHVEVENYLDGTISTNGLNGVPGTLEMTGFNNVEVTCSTCGNKTRFYCGYGGGGYGETGLRFGGFIMV